MTNDWDTPPFENEVEITCRVCEGNDDTCSNCYDGIETISKDEAEEIHNDNAEDFRE